MFRLAPYRPSTTLANLDASKTQRLSKDEILSAVDLSTQEAEQKCSAGSSKDGDRALERTDPVVKELTTALDELFCHKLLMPNKRYWPAVKEFLSRVQIEELVIRWGPKSERGYSLAWLFHSLNEGTLEYQLLSFRQGRHVLLRFYDKSAYVLDPGLLETVARFVARLNDARFDLKPPDQGVPPSSLDASLASISIPVTYSIVPDDRVPIARPAATGNGMRSAKAKRPAKSPNGAVTVGENGEVKKVERRRLKKATIAVPLKRASSGSQTGTPLSSTPIPRADFEDSLMSTGRDQDFLFREVLDYNRRTSPDGMEVGVGGGSERKGANGRRLSATSGGQPELTSDHAAAAAAPFQRWFQEPVIPQPQRQLSVKPSPAEDFDETLRRRLTAVKIDQASNFSDSLDMERGEKKFDVAKEEPKENGVTDGGAGDWKAPDCPEGEIMLESGQIVRLAVQVFVQEGERFYKLFRVYLHHNTGASLMRWLLLTNYAIYLLTRTAGGDTFALAAANRPDEQAEHANLERSDSKEHDLNYEIDKMTPLQQIDYISVGLCSQLFTVVVRDKTKSLTICTASELQTRSILSSLELAVRRCSTGRLEPPSVLTDATPQRLMLMKWAKSELDAPNLDIVAYTLVYWRTTPTGESDSSSAQMASRAGYLYHRRHFPKAWLQTNGDWQQSYFMLQGQKLYQFSDSSCKFGEKVFDLRHDIAGCRETQLKDHQNAFEFVLPNEEETMHFSCQTKHDAQQWTQAVLLALSTAGGTDEDDVYVASFLLLTTTHLLLGQESTSYGFVRTLACLALNQLDRVLVVRTDEQNAIAITPTDSKQRYWLLFRTAVELDRIIQLLRDKASVNAVETAQDSHDDSLISSTESTRVVEQCLEMADVWRTCTQF